MMRSQPYQGRGLEAMEANGPRLLLAEHHRSLHRAGEALLSRAHEDNPLSLTAEYRDFEKQILEHMATEEDVILPAYDQVEPVDAAAIREGHVQIRKQLERTAVDIELHEARLGAIRELLRVLDEHGKHEDHAMYPWAQVHLPVAPRHTLVTRLVASLRELARRAII